MRDPRESQVLAPLERELVRDPRLSGLVAELARFDAGRALPHRGRAPARPVLAAGLALMVLGCLTLSTAVAGIGIAVVVGALLLAAGRGGRAAGPGVRSS